MKNVNKHSLFIGASAVGVALAMGLGIRTFALSARLVEGDSMSPALHSGDMVLVNMWSKNFKPGDIIIFEPSQKSDFTLVKRIVGTPNSTVYIDNFRLYLNRQPASEGPGYQPVWNPNAFECRYSGVLKSGADEFVVLGDNRCSSSDSRVFGSIPRKSIIGKVIFNIPLSRFKRS